MNKKYLLLPSLIALLTIPANAQIITWGSAINMSTGSDVSANGNAFDAATLYGTSTAVNGVTFNALTAPVTGGLADASGDITIKYTGAVLSPGSTYTAYTGGSANYNNVVSTFAYSFNGGPTALTYVDFANLTVGDSYQVEVWAYDGKVADKGSAVTQLSGFGDGLLNPVTSSTPPAVGQYVLGDFTATGATDSFSLTAPGGTYSIINAVSVRDITTAPEPGTWALMLAGLACLALRHRRLFVV